MATTLLEYRAIKTFSDHRFVAAIENISLSPDGSMLAVGCGKNLLIYELQHFALKYEIQARDLTSGLTWMSTQRDRTGLLTDHLISGSPVSMVKMTMTDNMLTGPS